MGNALVFRNSKLLQRHEEVVQNAQNEDDRPVALLADANEAESELLRATLQKFKYRVVEVKGSADSIDPAVQSAVRLVVASLDLPSANGHYRYQEILENHGSEGIPFILITPPGIYPDKQLGYETYASDYIQRPIDLVEFESRLNDILYTRGENQSAQPPALNATHSSTILQDPKLGQGVGSGRFPLESGDMGADSAALVGPSNSISGKSFHQEATRQPSTPASPDAVLENAKNEETSEAAAFLYREACAFLQDSIARVEEDRPIDVEMGLQIAQSIVDSLRVNDSLLRIAMDRPAQFALVQHCINVAILSIPIARELGFEENRICRMCLAGMLHDIGSLKLPKELLHEARSFSDSDRAEIHLRPLFSAEILSNIPGFEWLPQIVSQVYERETGGGYPQGLKGKAILDEAKVLGLADMFEACTHHRPQRRAMTGYQSLEILTAEMKSYSERVTKAMLRSLTVYPLCEYVVLNTGEIGRVIGINKKHPLRPTVDVIYSSAGERGDQPKVINLSKNSSLWVVKSITDDELESRSLEAPAKSESGGR